jgi:MFS family permease
MVARGRRTGLVTGYAAAAAGGLLAAVALAAAPGPGGLVVVLVVAGMLLVGLGNAAAQLSRYVAADLFPPRRRGLAIGVVVWSGTVGAVGGPLLLGPTEDAAAALGSAPAAGPFAFAAAAAAVAALAAATVPARLRAAAPLRRDRGATVRTVLTTPAARTAFLVMATGQVVMVLVMTAVPLHLHHHGHGIGLVGAVLSAHTLGMFVLSPLTGRLLDAVGARPVALAGIALLLTGAAPMAFAERAPAVGLAGFALGLGWNLCFVGGSGALAREVPDAERTAVEGAVEAGVWGMAAVAGLVATTVLATGGIAVLATTAAVVALVPISPVVGRPAPRVPKSQPR